MGGFLFKKIIGSKEPGSNISVEHRATTNEERGRISSANFYNAERERKDFWCYFYNAKRGRISREM